MPLIHLIVLIVDAHHSAEFFSPVQDQNRDRRIYKDQLRIVDDDGAVSTQRPRPDPLQTTRLQGTRKPKQQSVTTRFLRHGDKIPGVDRKSIGQCPYSQFQTAAYVLTGKPAYREARNRLFTDTHSERSPPTPFTQTASLTRKPREMVEPDGIEPTTSCLQSTRSPN